SLGKPVRVPVFVVAEPKTVWMNFLTHNLLQSLLFAALFTRGLFLRSLLRRRLFGGGFGFFLLRRAFRTRRGGGSATFATLTLRQLRRLRLCFCRLSAFRHRSRIVAQRDRHVTEVSLLTISASLWRRSHATPVLRWSTIDKRGAHPQLV